MPVYGGWLRVKGHKYRPTFKICQAIASKAEEYDYDYIYFSENYLNVVYGEECEVADAWAYASALASVSKKIELVVAVKPGFHTPFSLARLAQGVNHVCEGRLSVNIVCGWMQREFQQYGIAYLTHDKRYERACEFTECIKKLWSGLPVNFDGDYYTLDNAIVAMGDHNDGEIPVWISGQSMNAKKMVARYGDVYFIDSMSDEELKKTIISLRDVEKKYNRKSKIAMSVFIIMRDSDEEAKARHQAIINNRQQNLIDKFREEMDVSGADMWKGLTDEQLVDSNCGFDACLIGSKQTILEKIHQLKNHGIDILLCQFEDMLNDTVEFGEKILPELSIERMKVI